MSLFCRRLGSCLIVLVLCEMFGGAFARGDLEPVFTSVLHGNYVVVGTSISEARGSVLEPNDPITLTVGIPVGSTVVRAFLNWSYLAVTPAPAFLADITVNGAPITAESSYEGPKSLCRLDRDFGRTFVYQVDLTDIVAAQIVNGSGVFTITEIVEEDDSAEVPETGPLGEGVSLLVVYSDPIEPLRLINVYSGIVQTNFDVSSFETPLSFVDPNGGAVRYAGGAVHFFLNALGGECTWDDFLLNGTQVVDGVLGVGVFNDAWIGKLGLNFENFTYFNFYDHAEGDASSFMNVNDTQLTIGGRRVVTPFILHCDQTDPNGFPGDCVGHSFAAIAFDIVPCPRLFVDTDAPADGNGQSWPTAYRFLQDALDPDNIDPVCSTDTAEIWVAEGTYRADETAASPNGTGGKLAKFKLIDRVKIIGGFAGWETDPIQRDLVNNTTILSGDLMGNDIANLPDGLKCFTGEDCEIFGFGCVLLAGCESFDTNNDGMVLASELNIDDNSQFVVSGSGTDETAVLDGFVITAGNGAGMTISSGDPTIQNCRFDTNLNPVLGSTGGGVILSGSSATPSFTNCVFTNNVALLAGGGLATLTPG